MLNHFDIDGAIGEVGQNEPIFRRDDLSFTDGPLDLYAGTLIISGDGGPGCVVRGQGNVVINGSFIGNKRMPARIEVDGDVVVTGVVSHAVLDARCVYVGGDVSDAQVNARLELAVGGNLGPARVRMGEYDLERKKIDELTHSLQNARWTLDATERKLRMEEKRVDKMFKNTRVTLAANVGRILQGRRNRLVVNLEPIYESLPNRQEEEIDKALREFFAKAIVGLLTRANQHFLVGKNRHRQEIFKGIVRDVHDLFFLTRKFDKETQSCVGLRQLIDQAIEALDGRMAHVFVQGNCLPELTVSVIVPEVTVSDTGKVLVSGDMARLRVGVAEGGGLDIQCVGTLGIEAQQTLGVGSLKNCQLSMTDGELAWQAIDTCDPVEV